MGVIAYKDTRKIGLTYRKPSGLGPVIVVIGAERRASAPLISAADIPQPKVTMTLDAYLRENNQSIFDFSVRNGINTNSVYRAAREQTVKWNTAKAISAATGGSVTISEIMD